MSWIHRFLNRHPVWVCVLILLGAAWAFWRTHEFVVHTIQPAQAAAARAQMEAQIAGADAQLKRKQFPAALSTYRYILAAHGERLAAAEKGTLHHRIGLCLKGLSERTEEKENLAKAIAAFNEALAFRDAASDPAGYGETQGQLGLAHARLALAASDTARFDEAIAAFNEAARVRTPTADPQGYAALQIQIGNAHRERFEPGEKQDDARMAPALAAYGIAENLAREQQDMDTYARVNLERSQAYLKLAEGVFKRTNTRAALADLELALEVFKPNHAPRDYGRAQRILGDVYMKMYKEVPVKTGTAWRDSQQRTAWQQSALRAYELASQFGALNAPRATTLDK